MEYSVLESSFCEYCDNLMDITNSISQTVLLENDIQDNESDESNKLNDNNKQEGGTKLNNLAGVQIESSDYDVSLSESVGGSNISDDEISNILDGSDTEVNLASDFDITQLNKNSAFNKLSNQHKTLVINRILEKNPKHKKNKNVSSLTSSGKESFFYCKTCGNYKLIPNKKFIFSKANDKKNKIYNYNFLNLVNDNTLPTTKKYNCINPICSTHKNPQNKNAVFYRHSDSYNIRYICKICNKFWDTYSIN